MIKPNEQRVTNTLSELKMIVVFVTTMTDSHGGLLTFRQQYNRMSWVCAKVVAK